MADCRSLVFTGLAAAAFGLTACAGPAAPATTPPEAETSPTAPAVTASPHPAPEIREGMAERDQFIRDQQQPLDGSLLVAITEPQKALVRQQREYVQSQGGTWNAESESVTLALALDACETSILNGHEVDDAVFLTHVMSSPLIRAVAGDDPQAQTNVASIMVFGTGFLCPDDAPQWQSAWEAAYG